MRRLVAAVQFHLLFKLPDRTEAAVGNDKVTDWHLKPLF